MTRAEISADAEAPKRSLRPNFAGMLPELRSIPNWVLADQHKVPRQPDGMPASVSASVTWSSFERVKAAFDPTKYIGIGFVLDGRRHFNGKYLHAFDWDHCIANGRINLTVVSKVSELQISRLELSVSGTGLRGFFLHDELLPNRKTKLDGRSVELYSTSRYMITTGIALPGKELLL